MTQELPYLPLQIGGKPIDRALANTIYTNIVNEATKNILKYILKNERPTIQAFIVRNTKSSRVESGTVVSVKEGKYTLVNNQPTSNTILDLFESFMYSYSKKDHRHSVITEANKLNKDSILIMVEDAQSDPVTINVYFAQNENRDIVQHHSEELEQWANDFTTITEGFAIVFIHYKDKSRNGFNYKVAELIICLVKSEKYMPQHVLEPPTLEQYLTKSAAQSP